MVMKKKEENPVRSIEYFIYRWIRNALFMDGRFVLRLRTDF